MLWSKVIGAGGTLGPTGLRLSSNYTDFRFNSATYTIPLVGPSVGDLAIIHYTTLHTQMAGTPSGWSQISYNTSGSRQAQRVIYKILTPSDLGSVLTLSLSESLVGTYAGTRLITFTPSVDITGAHISSLTSDVNTVPVRTKDTSQFDPPNIVFAAASFYLGNNNGGFSETYWTQEYINTDMTTRLITAFEIQNDSNINRTITPLFTGSALINHSFVLNLIT